ncbi:MAG: NAD(P)-dependent alcohol dehydrogenase [Anaerolineae bacterium]|jgi:NADPH:quinone reductase-like Zn-dependent oxidoreductase
MVAQGTMKAVVYHDYGPPDNLELRDVKKPIPGDDEVLIRVCAASVNWHDYHFLTGTPFLARIMAGGLLRPKHRILGSDLAGQVEAVGRNVERIRPGDDVFGSLGSGGAFAEYVCAREDDLQPKPGETTFEEAAAAGAAAFVALQGLRDKGGIKAGQSVLINGASGGVGTFAVQIAKSFGTHVTGVCSARNVDLVRSIGADQVIDYTREDCIEAGQIYDLIFDVAAKLSFSACERILSPKGSYVTTEFSPALALQGLWTSATGDKRMVPLLAKAPSGEDQVSIKELLEAGDVTPVIDRRYPLNDVPDALRYLAQGHARGKIVIAV